MLLPGQYFRTPTGEECPLKNIVVTEDDCKIGANELWMTWAYRHNSTVYPAGCFFYQNGVYFNPIIDPSKTDVDSVYGGICQSMSLLFIYIGLADFQNLTKKLQLCIRKNVFVV